MMKWLLLIISTLIFFYVTPIVYFNFITHSLPNGIYLRVSGVPKRGDYAATCLTPQIAQYGIVRGYLMRGSCVSGTVGILKIIKGVPGDYYSIIKGSLLLNGKLYGVMDRDSSGRALKEFYNTKGVIGRDKYFLLSDFVKNSWDSRYWGPVSIQFLLRPLWVLGKRAY